MSFDNTYAVLDVESGSIHAVDKIVYDYLNGDTNGYSLDEIREVENEILSLKSEGLLDSECLYDGSPVFNKPVIKAMCLHAAHDCNLRCKYCFANGGEYPGKRSLMSTEIAFSAIDFLMANSGTRHNLEVDFFGGEPLLNFEMVKNTVKYGREIEKKFNKNIRFTMTTNAYNVTDEMAAFINKEMKNLVISIDGRKEIHDYMRPDAGGHPTYEIIVKNAKKLLKNRNGKEYYIRGTYTAKNLDFTNDVMAIAELGFDSISIEPVVSATEIGLKEEHLPLLKKEYEILAREFEKRQKAGKGFTFFHFMVDLTSGPCLNKRLRGCGAGIEYVAVTPNGDIYPCHQFADQPDFLLGNVKSGINRPDIVKRFSDNHVFSKPECSSCWAKYYCSGGCAANAFFENGDISKPHKISCELEKKRLETAILLEVRKNLS